MKPTDLTPGQRVLITPSLGLKKPYHGIFVRRIPRKIGRRAYSIIRVDEFAGLPSSPLGECPYSDYDVARWVQPLEACA
ncbi:hypothetical protein JRC42_19605 [Escherichia albertii]|uniref:hypothetical protein n=1 Tax=Escherichia albertii TaxID=208962 RepID=UPI00195C0123|nr:hypothetical protein [Escherichia albertii]QST27746.1 hypothetical protein JRC42_19605 [Escherichia albertii]QST37113.1 hypothetical protein JRC46_19605 [Escherichia albertii]